MNDPQLQRKLAVTQTFEQLIAHFVDDVDVSMEEVVQAAKAAFESKGVPLLEKSMVPKTMMLVDPETNETTAVAVDQEVIAPARKGVARPVASPFRQSLSVDQVLTQIKNMEPVSIETLGANPAAEMPRMARPQVSHYRTYLDNAPDVPPEPPEDF